MVEDWWILEGLSCPLKRFLLSSTLDDFLETFMMILVVDGTVWCLKVYHIDLFPLVSWVETHGIHSL